MKNHIHLHEKVSLLLVFLVGLCLNGTWDAFFNSLVSFSLFPVIALALTVYCLHDRYQKQTMSAGFPSLLIISFLLGWFIYSAVSRVTYPQIGSNFLVSIVCIVLVFLLIYRWKRFVSPEGDILDPIYTVKETIVTEEKKETAKTVARETAKKGTAKQTTVKESSSAKKSTVKNAENKKEKPTAQSGAVNAAETTKSTTKKRGTTPK